MQHLSAAVPLALLAGLLLGCQSSAPARRPAPAPARPQAAQASAAPEKPDFTDQQRYLVPVEFLDTKAPAAAPEPMAAPMDGEGQAEQPGQPPRPGLVWVPAHRVWRHSDWVQVPGQWLKPQPGTSAYVPGFRREAAPGRYEWVPGYWR